MDERFIYKRSQALREYVTSFHLTVMFLGLSTLSIGAYLINSTVSRKISVLLLVLGGITTIISFIGCFGSYLEHTGFINTYSSFTAIALIIEIVAMGLVYSHKSKLDEYGSTVWGFLHEKDPDFLLDIEQFSKCCGYASVSDRAIPISCPITLNTNIGCRDVVAMAIQDWQQWITIALICFLGLQFCMLLVSIILSFFIDKETRDEETYMALLSTQNNHHSWSGGESISGSGYFGRQRSNYTQRVIPKYGSSPSR
ncbi:Tetraspanin family-domain-containing protein [Pilobolus umbonatus]|nr:Tetraspanin family-domain-containing protein [Pilobolus umbonatus]